MSEIDMTRGVYRRVCAEEARDAIAEKRLRQAATWGRSDRRGDGWHGPYDSAVERDFAEAANKAYHGMVRLDKQVGVWCGNRAYRVDFVASTDTRSIGIEIDGRHFHDAERDAVRDDAILQTGKLARVYRFPAALMYYGRLTAVLALWRVEPWLYLKSSACLVRAAQHEHVTVEHHVQWRSSCQWHHMPVSEELQQVADAEQEYNA